MFLLDIALLSFAKCYFLYIDKVFLPCLSWITQKQLSKILISFQIPHLNN